MTLLLCSAVLADKEQPLPTRKSVKRSRSGVTYNVEGRQVIGYDPQDRSEVAEEDRD